MASFRFFDIGNDDVPAVMTPAGKLFGVSAADVDRFPISMAEFFRNPSPEISEARFWELVDSFDPEVRARAEALLAEG